MNPNPFSIPSDECVWWRCFDESEMTIVEIDPPVDEGWFDPETPEVLEFDHGMYYQYNITDIADPFYQQQGNIYWMELCMTVQTGDPQPEWGWKTSVNHWNDDAVWRGTNWDELLDPLDPGTPNVDVFAVDSSDLIPPGPVNDWYYYENTEWWNIWFYDDPPDPARKKRFRVSFELIGPTSADFQIAVNWSTLDWPPDSGPPLPPLTPEEEAQFIGRYIFEPPAGAWEPGSYEFYFFVHQYNPEWVSIDVRGTDFVIVNGEIEHTCLNSLDMAFVINGGLGPIPTVSQWGLAAMVLLVLAAGTIVFRKYRAAA
jgi:hypothetical protein